MWVFYSIYSVFFTVSLNVSRSDSFDARSFFQLHDLNRRVQHGGLRHALRAYRRVLETASGTKMKSRRFMACTMSMHRNNPKYDHITRRHRQAG